MTEKKLTQKDYFNMIIELAQENNRKDIVDFCLGRIELLNKKSSSKTPSKNQIANENLKTIILNVLSENAKPMTISEIQASNEELSTDNGISNQKVSALLTQLINVDKVVRTIDKKKAYFSINA